MTDAILAAILVTLMFGGLTFAAHSIRRAVHRRDSERTQRDLERSIRRARGEFP